MPQDDCIGTWIKSVRVSSLTDDTEVDAGKFVVELVNGVLSARYVVGTVSQTISVRCDPDKKHDILTLSRTEAGKVITYSGRVIFIPSENVHVIQRGTYVSVSSDDITNIDAADTGDWSAENPGN